jgi:hypothetical protein
MADGLNEYRHKPLLWCSLAVLEINEFDIEDDSQCTPENIQRLVERTMEFITVCFEDEELPVPTATQIIEHTLKRVELLRS